MTVVRDSREKTKLDFFDSDIIIVERCLPVGDYSIEGCEDIASIEVKHSLYDLARCLVNGRLSDQVRRLSVLEFGAVVVGCDYDDILSYKSKHKSPVTPRYLVRLLDGIRGEYPDVEFHYTRSPAGTLRQLLQAIMQAQAARTIEA